MGGPDTQAGERLEAFLRAAPKAEMHLHLEGAVPWDLVRGWSPEPLPERPAWWAHDHRFASFGAFLEVMRASWRPYLDGPERIAEACGGIFSRLQAQNVRYVELSFGLGAYSFPAAEIASAVREPAPPELCVRVIAGISRDRDLDTMLRLAREAVRGGGVDGIDLHGDERAGRLKDFAPVYREARERGLVTKAHAGELGGPETVRETVDVLGVERIEHGVSAARSPEVMRFLADQGTVLDVCPWSNVKLGVAPDLARHPVRDLYRAGLPVTVSTDDPTVFGQTLTEELGWLGTEAGLNLKGVAEVVRNGFRAARMPEADRAACLAAVDEAAGD